MVKYLIVCEGKNDKDFLEELLKHLQIFNIDINFLGRDSKNKSSIFKQEKYDSKKEEVGSLYKKMLIIFDSDYEKNDVKYGGYINSEEKIKLLIIDLGLENLVDYYIVCDPITKEGYLESLILSTLPEEERKCIKLFLECSNFKDKEKDKAIYNQIYKLGYPNKPYDFSHPYFEKLIEKIKNLG